MRKYEIQLTFAMINNYAENINFWYKEVETDFIVWWLDPFNDIVCEATFSCSEKDIANNLTHYVESLYTNKEDK